MLKSLEIEQVQESKRKSLGGGRRGLLGTVYCGGNTGLRQGRIRGENISVVICGLRGIVHSQSEGWGMWFGFSHSSIFRLFLLLVEWIVCLQDIW